MRTLISRLFSGLRFRLLLLVVLACTPLVGLTLYTAWQNHQRLVADWEQQAQEMVQLAIQEEAQMIGQTRQLLMAMADSSQVHSGDRQDCKELLDDLFASYPRYADLGVIKTNGELAASALAPAGLDRQAQFVRGAERLLAKTVVPPTGTANQAHRELFRRVLETRALVIGDFPAGHADGEPAIDFGYPVFDQAGQIQAMVFAALKLNWVNRFESELLTHLRKGATWTELDRNGNILTRYPDPGKWIGQPLPEQSLLQTVLSQDHGVVEALDPEGVPGFYAFASMPSQLVRGGAVTILGVRKQVLFAGTDRRLIRYLLGLGIAISVVLAVGWISSRYLVMRPVQALVNSSARLASGDLSARTGLLHRSDELGQLTQAFDQMAEALEQREMARQRAEETLQIRENMMRDLPLLPAALYVCDMQGVIDLYNRNAVELWGYEPADHYAAQRFCGSHKLFDADGSPLAHQGSPMAEVLRTGVPVRNRELAIERPDASRVTVLANVVPIRDGEGQIVGAINCLQDITERKLAEEKLKEYSHKLQTLSHRLVEAQETERRHIARELHDEIGQTLTVAAMNLQAALRSPSASSLALRLKASAEAVDQVMAQVHDLSLNLRPSMLDDLGLEPALRWYANRQASLTGLRVEFRAAPLENRLEPVVETECFRVAQEALTNVVRHAHAHAVSVELQRANGHLHLYVRDDGAGFDVAAVREQAVRGASLGLLSMEERAALAGGGLAWKSSPEQGTEVHAWFPLKWHTPQS